jgi:hypothetical protein
MATPAAPIPPVAEVREFDTAEELLSELSPVTGEIWQQPFRQDAEWLFRGHSNGADGSLWTSTRPRCVPEHFCDINSRTSNRARHPTAANNATANCARRWTLLHALIVRG